MLPQYLFPLYFYEFLLSIAELAGSQNWKEIMKILIFLIARSSVWSSAKNHFSIFTHSERPLALWADPINPVGLLLELNSDVHNKTLKRVSNMSFVHNKTTLIFTDVFVQLLIIQHSCPEIQTRNAGAVIAKTYSEVACAILAQHLKYSLQITVWACVPFLLAYSPTYLLHSLAKDPYLIFKDHLLPNSKTIKYQIRNIKIQSKFCLKPDRTISNWKFPH